MSENETKKEDIKQSLFSTPLKSKGKPVAKKESKFLKSRRTASLISKAVNLLSDVGIPMEKLGPRRRVRTAMALLALLGVKKSFSELKEIDNPVPLKSREVLQFWNDNFEEKLKDSSYDDVRSENLDLLVLGFVAHNVGDLNGGAKNDSRRKFSINLAFLGLLKQYGTEQWKEALEAYKADVKTLREEFERAREMNKISIKLPDGLLFTSNNDPHNILQKAILEDFIPRFLRSCKILYFGDATKRTLHINKEKLEELGFFEIGHEELPDIIAYDEEQDWLFMIEAYHSTGEWDEERVLKLKRKIPHLIESLVFVTAFLNKEAFRAKAGSIAWETEVWIADTPDHMIHFNGDKFLGPYKNEQGDSKGEGF